MTLDKNKKYEFAGDVYWFAGAWIGDGCVAWSGADFQFFANKGLVKEHREPIVGRGRVSFDTLGMAVDFNFSRIHCGLTADQAANRTFDIVATEVLP